MQKNEEVKVERQRVKKVCLERSKKAERFHQKQNPSVGQSMTRGHVACHAATKQLIWGVEPQAP